MKKIIMLFSVLAVFILTSCDKNKNIFGRFHKAGSSSSTEVLLNDANAALDQDDPAKAKEIADKILATEPGNSEALYISAEAGLKEAGFDLGGIITSVIGGTSGSDDSLLDSFKEMDINNVAAAIDEAVTNLKKIADGNSDGSIPWDDVDVNLNLGILELLDTVIDIVNFDGDDKVVGDEDDVIHIDEDYNVTIRVGGSTKTVSELTPEDIQSLSTMTYLVDGATVTIAEKLESSLEQMSSAVDHLIVANEKAGIIEEGDDTSTITDLKKSIDEDLKPKLDDFIGALKLVAPGNLAATAVSSSQIDLTWTDNADGETGFKIDRALSLSGPWTQIGTSSANATSYSDTGLNPVTIYYYRVFAYNEMNDGGYSLPAYATTQL